MAAGMKKVKPVEPVISETQNNPYMDAIAEASRGSDKPVTAAVPVSEGPDPWGYKPAQNYTTGLSNMVWNPDARGMDFQEDSLPTGTRSYGRSSYSASSGGNGSPYAAAIEAFDYGPAPAWDGTEYERRRDEALQRAENMQFEFDPDTDPSWQAYQKQYRREGQRATADALGQAAAMTGGVPSSYAVTAASQAGDYYAAQLSDRLPQLYQDAYNRYLQEYQRQLGIADAYAGYGQTEYNRYLDQLGQYNTDRNFAYGAYRDRVGDQRYADETAYARQRAAEEWEYQQARDAIGDQRYQTEWERKIADADLDNALAVAKYLGYVPEQYAEILGVPAGTQYYTLANKTTGGSGGGRSSGSGGTGGKDTGEDEGDQGDQGNKGGNVNKFPQLAAYVLEAAKLGTDTGDLQKMMDTYYNNGWITADEYDRLAEQYNASFAKEPEVGNRHGDSWVAMSDNTRISYNQLKEYVKSGKIKATLRDGKYWYTWA